MCRDSLFRPPNKKFEDKVFIPQDNHPETNFVGLLIGPRCVREREREGGRDRGMGSGSGRDERNVLTSLSDCTCY